jgi:putative transposase
MIRSLIKYAYNINIQFEYGYINLHEILAARHALYLQARELNPARWSGNTRNWTPVGAVTLNPERDTIVKTHLASNNIQPLAA